METIKTVCKTCQRTEDDCGHPYTKEYLDSHKGNCMNCAILDYSKTNVQSGQKRKVKECRECGRNFKPKAKYDHCIYCWNCWNQK